MRNLSIVLRFWYIQTGSSLNLKCLKNRAVNFLKSNVPQHRVFFARGVSPGQKRWPSFLGREIWCNQGDKHALKVPCFFFPFMFGGGEEFFIFPSFPMCSHYVPFKFLKGSQYVPQSCNVFPNMFSTPPHLYPICLAKWCPPFTCISGPNGRNYILQNRGFCFGESP